MLKVIQCFQFLISKINQKISFKKIKKFEKLTNKFELNN